MKKTNSLISVSFRLEYQHSTSDIEVAINEYGNPYIKKVSQISGNLIPLSEVRECLKHSKELFDNDQDLLG
jgi:hypothetical protein